MKRLSRTLLLFTALISFAGAVQADTQIKKIAFLPFSQVSGGDISYLNDSILSMLASRVYLKDEIEVVPVNIAQNALEGYSKSQPVNQFLAQEIAGDLSCDYVCFGTLTEIGGIFSLDVTIVDRLGTNPPRSFFGNSGKSENALYAVNQVADDINEKVFSRVVIRKKRKAELSQEEKQNAHPESLLKGITYGSDAVDDSPFWKIW